MGPLAGSRELHAREDGSCKMSLSVRETFQGVMGTGEMDC